MARTIQSPGVEIKEIDLTLNARLPVGTNVFLQGFAQAGPTQELVNVTSVSELEQIYDLPCTPAERYFYHSAKQVLINSNANLLVNRLPYGTGDGEGFGNYYSALVYPVLAVPSGGFVADNFTSITSATSSLSVTLSSADEYYLGEPTQLILTESDYLNWKAGAISWATEVGTVAPSSISDAGNSGLILVNKLKTTIDDKFAGHYIGLTDNSKATVTSTSGDIVFNSILSVESSLTTPSTGTVIDSDDHVTVPETRFEFSLSGDIVSAPNSISETIETVPTWDFGSNAYDDSIIIGLFKLRPTLYGDNENISLDQVLVEGHTGSLDKQRKWVPPNDFGQESYYIQTQLEDKSSFIDVFVNPNISDKSGAWLDENGDPNRKVRVLDATQRTALETALDALITGFSANANSPLATTGYMKNGDSLYAFGPYQPANIVANKQVGSVTQKLEIGYRLAEDRDVIPMDLVLDAGLSTIYVHSSLAASASADGIFDDEAEISGIFSGSGTDYLAHPSSGNASTAQDLWQVIFNQHNTFVSQTRKDCMAIVDPLRGIFIQGKNLRTLDDKTKNFSQHIYTPLRNLVSEANSNYCATYAQWAKVFDSQLGDFVWLPFSGYAATIMANVDSNLQPWFAPAGLNNGIVRGVSDVALYTTMKHRDFLYRNSLNPVVFFPGDGFVVWGQKTLQKKPSAFDRINVRRLFLVLEKATRSIMRYFVFEPNTSFTRARVVNTLTPIFEVPKNNEGIFDYLIVCDERNNTADIIDNNELVVDIYIKPVRTAEFILVNFIATKTGDNFNELI